MLVEGIWPPSLVPLFLKDGGHLPSFVDAEEKRELSFQNRKLHSPQNIKRCRRASSIINAATDAVSGVFSERRCIRKSKQFRSVSTTSFSESSLNPAFSASILLPTDEYPQQQNPTKKFSVRFNVCFKKSLRI